VARSSSCRLAALLCAASRARARQVVCSAEWCLRASFSSASRSSASARGPKGSRWRWTPAPRTSSPDAHSACPGAVEERALHSCF
jgi:hypothetical protein